MTEESGFSHKTVKVQDLKDNMVILAYSGFSKKFQPMDETTCKFIKHNFDKAKAVIIRNYEEMDIPVKEIKVGDSLHRLHHFPPSLNKLTTANSKLAKALQRRGFTEFSIKQEGLERAEKKELKDAIDIVKLTSKSNAEKREKLKIGKEKAEKFVHQLKDNLETRKKASKAVENIMDNARSGRIDYSEIETYVNEIAKHSSAEAMSAIMSLKESDQTYDHCVD
ncbi:hypothetical protein KKA14_11855, partial [bacterium]|nr:hypothetical protein [bacterium]